jgi:hypothetical protein
MTAYPLVTRAELAIAPNIHATLQGPNVLEFVVMRVRFPWLSQIMITSVVPTQARQQIAEIAKIRCRNFAAMAQHDLKSKAARKRMLSRAT